MGKGEMFPDRTRSETTREKIEKLEEEATFKESSEIHEDFKILKGEGSEGKKSGLDAQDFEKARQREEAKKILRDQYMNLLGGGKGKKARRSIVDELNESPAIIREEWLRESISGETNRSRIKKSYERVSLQQKKSSRDRKNLRKWRKQLGKGKVEMLREIGLASDADALEKKTRIFILAAILTIILLFAAYFLFFRGFSIGGKEIPPSTFKISPKQTAPAVVGTRDSIFIFDFIHSKTIVENSEANVTLDVCQEGELESFRYSLPDDSLTRVIDPTLENGIAAKAVVKFQEGKLQTIKLYIKKVGDWWRIEREYH